MRLRNKTMAPRSLVFSLFGAAWGLLFAMGNTVHGQERPRVELELFMEQGVSPSASHAWIQRLKRFEPEGLRFRGELPGDELAINNVGTDRRPVYQVIGRLNVREEIEVPGAVIPPNRPTLLMDYLEALRQDGPEAVTKQRTAFGLTVSQFKEVHDDLAAVIDFSTVNMPSGEVVKKIAGKLKHEVQTTKQAASELALPEAIVADELQGLSSGAGLAAALRPAGLVFDIQRAKDGFRYVIRQPEAEKEAWPIGWDASEKSVVELAPQLRKIFEVELNDVQLSQAVSAIQQRLDLPMLFDWNSLAEEDIRLETKTVKLKKSKLTYQIVLDRILGQAQLKMELRIDENDHPFLWVSTLKKIQSRGQR